VIDRLGFKDTFSTNRRLSDDDDDLLISTHKKTRRKITTIYDQAGNTERCAADSPSGSSVVLFAACVVKPSCFQWRVINLN